MITSTTLRITSSSQPLASSRLQLSNFASQSWGQTAACILLVSQCLMMNLSCSDDVIDTPYEEVKEAQDWWKSVDIPGQVKELVGRTNAIRVFKLPLEE